jgi:hypothetical protein
MTICYFLRVSCFTARSRYIAWTAHSDFSLLDVILRPAIRRYRFSAFILKDILCLIISTSILALYIPKSTLILDLLYYRLYSGLLFFFLLCPSSGIRKNTMFRKLYVSVSFPECHTPSSESFRIYLRLDCMKIKLQISGLIQQETARINKMCSEWLAKI